MRLADIDLALSPANDRERDVFARVRRALQATRDAIGEAYSRVQAIRYNQPPTTPATPAGLPTASIKYLGQMYLLDMNAAADDEAWICIRESGGAYAWVQFAPGTGGAGGPTVLDWIRW